MNKPPRPVAPDQELDLSMDRALAVLRQVPSPQGLESRLLDSLQQRQPPTVRVPRRRWLPATLVLAPVFALVAALVFRAPTRPSVKPPASPFPPLASLSSSAVLASPSPFQHRARALRRRALPASVLASTNSFPAPPAPLTQQERLLLQVAHASDPQDFNLLNPETVARELAENRADFDRFFPPPAPPETSTPVPAAPTSTHPSPAPQETSHETRPTPR